MMDGSFLNDSAVAPLWVRLDALRVEAPEIAAAAYLDLNAQLVLGRRAVRLLCGSGGDEALFAGPLEMVAIQRLPVDDGTALCLFFDPETPPRVARAASREAARRVPLALAA
jgi:hypothetical protein